MSKIYDLSQLEELAGGSNEFVMSMVDTFLEHTPGQVDDLKSNYAEGNMEAVGGIAHKIKPNIDLFGIQELTEVIRSIEAAGKAGVQSEQLAKDIQQVHARMQVAFDQLRELKG
jgi:HPt (histidine-containing phosphotransfer) domain-containing protein